MRFQSLILVFLMTALANTVWSQTTDTLVALDNHGLYFRVVKGKGVPIVFESGAGNDGSVWEEICALLRQRTDAPLIAYDRAGFGCSGIDTGNINITAEVTNLEIALKKLGYDGPYFFVAHSLGGNYVMKFIVNNRSRVKGAVFIDIISPYFMTEERASYTKNLFIDSLQTIKKESIGYYHLVINYENTSEVMRRAAKKIDIPFTVIASGKTPFEGKTRRNFIISLKRFATERDNRSYVMVENAEHYVFYDEPQLVIDEIVERYQVVTNRK